jgi:SAM-dependent methyltransferase
MNSKPYAVDHFEGGFPPNLGVTDAETEAAFAPFVHSRYALDDPQWKALVEPRAKGELIRRLRGYLRRLMSRAPALTQERVQEIYRRRWSKEVLNSYEITRESKVIPCVWRDRGMTARALGTHRVQQLFLMRAIERLKPRSVIEVGCGNGLQLLPLAARFPHIAFTGLELTTAGIAAVRSVQSSAYLPEEIGRFSPEPLVDREAHRRITMVQGDASKLPFADAAFDLVYTCLALEQMEMIRDAAMREIARIARRHVAMVEPFRDYNDTGIRRNFIIASGYFAARVGDLPKYGLEPVFETADWPHKVNLLPALVIARRAMR